MLEACAFYQKTEKLKRWEQRGETLTMYQRMETHYEYNYIEGKMKSWKCNRPSFQNKSEMLKHIPEKTQHSVLDY